MTTPTLSPPGTSEPIYTAPSADASSDRSTRSRRQPSPLGSKLSTVSFSPPFLSPSSLDANSHDASWTSHWPSDSGRDPEQDADEDEDEDEDMSGRPPVYRPDDGNSQMPLLKDERGRPSYDSPNGSSRPALAVRRSTFRSRSPDLESASTTRTKYIYAALFLGVSLVAFTVQTETAVYIQHDLGWDKAYCML